MFARACARARLPLRYSEGFNPRPRISLPLPRPVGVASEAERLLIELSEPIETEQLTARLSEQLPPDIRILCGRMLDSGDRCQPERVRYRIATHGVDRSSLQDKAARLLRPEPIPYRRFVHKDSRHVQIDLRPYVESIDVGAEHVDVTLRVTADGSAKPAEICDLLGIASSHVNHLVRRVEIVWQESQSLRTQ